MPMCGFDKQMLDGLGMFYQGLIDAVIRKTKKKNIVMGDAIMLELREMDDFLKELVVLDNEVDKQKLIGITNYAKSFYLGALRRAKKEGISIKEAMNIEIKKTRNFLFEVDRYFYEYLEGKKEQPMKELVKWIETKN